VVHAHPHQLVLIGAAHPNLAPVALPREPTVLELGFVPDDDLRALLTGAAALAFPSRAEGFGLPPLEAQACGTPAVVSDLPVLRESAGPDAVFVAPGDPAAWAEALVAAVTGALPHPSSPERTWDDAAHELLDAMAPLR
jgi:glycosyltransferase involved in cell wall biosynthesis